jgi:hypothetical protein
MKNTEKEKKKNGTRHQTFKFFCLLNVSYFTTLDNTGIMQLSLHGTGHDSFDVIHNFSPSRHAKLQ